MTLMRVFHKLYLNITFKHSPLPLKFKSSIRALAYLYTVTMTVI